MAQAPSDFANYCCELLASAGHCVPKRMFGGFGISTDGLTLAIIADLGGGEKLWLKGDADTRSRYEAAGCAIFTFDMKGVPRSMNYFSAPEEAMDSPDAMRPWAALALDCALRARAAKPPAKPRAKVVVKSAAPIKTKAPAQRSAANKVALKAAPKTAKKTATKAVKTVSKAILKKK